MSPNDRPRIPPALAPRDEPLAPLEPEAPSPPAVAAAPRRRSIVTRVLLWTLLTLVLVLVLVGLTPPAAVLWLRWHAPPTTAFMIQSEVQPVAYHWVPAAQIPEALRLAVIASEDQKFRTHWGFDFYAIAEALEHNEKSKRKRGASTITQQTAKNLFLWPSRSWLRKGLEVTFTLLLEGELSKDRILEIYLNIVEFGPGIYGVDAAAQKFFGTSSDKLTPAQCAQLAAVLPNPRKWSASHPGPYVQSRVDWILVQIGQRPRFSTVPQETEGPPEPSESEAPEYEDSAAPAGSSPETPPPHQPGVESSRPAEPSQPAEPSGSEEQAAPSTDTPPAQPDAPAEPAAEPRRY
jgi:monofunctional biosynthetic peptidoglycan transglycosylase